jgi:putative PIN family toxin of toxin-antitoxin system
VNAESLRVVLDTNVVVAAAINRQGIPAWTVALGLAAVFTVCYSKEILSEYEEVLTRGKFDLPAKDVRALMTNIKRSGKAFDPKMQLHLSPDPKDNKFLECAEEAEAHYLVSGNTRHFPARHRSTTVVTPREFVTILVGAGII